MSDLLESRRDPRVPQWAERCARLVQEEGTGTEGLLADLQTQGADQELATDVVLAVALGIRAMLSLLDENDELESEELIEALIESGDDLAIDEPFARAVVDGMLAYFAGPSADDEPS